MTVESCSIRQKIGSVMVYPWRISLDTPHVETTVPQLRGVWGAALHDLDMRAYEDVFQGTGLPHERTPLYAMRPAAPDPTDAPALEWIVIGDGVYHLPVLFRAWEIASEMGLGPDRDQFRFRRLQSIHPDGTLAYASWGRPLGWPLSDAMSIQQPERCRLSFPAPLRIIRDKQLVTSPRLPDIIATSIQRLRTVLDREASEFLRSCQSGAIALADRTPAEKWVGEPCDLIRYSGRQKKELEFRGVVGFLDLPEGPGELWPFIAAAQWLHIGKGSAVGMGQLIVESY